MNRKGNFTIPKFIMFITEEDTDNYFGDMKEFCEKSNFSETLYSCFYKRIWWNLAFIGFLKEADTYPFLLLTVKDKWNLVSNVDQK